MATSGSGNGDSGSGSSGGGSGTGDNSGGGGGTSNSGASITDLTGDLQKFADAGSPNLTFTPEASKKLVDLIKTYKSQLEGSKIIMSWFADMGPEGTLPSAQATKKNLLFDITGPGGAVDMAQKCVDYLDALADAVGKAGVAMESHG